MLTVEEEQQQKVLETLSNEELTSLEEYITLVQNGKEHELTAQQKAAIEIYEHQLDEIRNTGKLSVSPRGYR